MSDVMTKGTIVEALPNGQFRVDIGNPPEEKIIRAYVSGKMRMNKIRCMVGDKVEVKLESTGNIHRITRRG